MPMQHYLPEVFLQRALAAHLHMQGYQVREEVLFGNSRFDVVASKGNRILGFEVKLSSWKRAMKQTKIYRLCCDEVYLVIPSVKLTDPIKNRCEAEGIGLITIGPPPEWPSAQIIAAPESTMRNALHHASIQRIAAFR